MARIIGIFLAGLFVLLPIFVTVVVIAWIATFLSSYVGPGSLIGRLISAASSCSAFWSSRASGLGSRAGSIG